MTGLKSKVRPMFLAGVLALAPSLASATVIEFEDSATGTSPSLISSPYSEAGFSFTTTADNMLSQPAGSPNSRVPKSGSDSLVVNAGTNVVLTMTRIGGPFDVLSALVAEGRTSGSGFERFASSRLVFTGERRTGGSVTQSFDMDRFAPADNPEAFELVNLIGFTDLTSLAIQAFGSLDAGSFQDGYSFSIDSIVTRVGAIPVSSPGTALFFGFGLFAFAQLKRGKSRQEPAASA